MCSNGENILNFTTLAARKWVADINTDFTNLVSNTNFVHNNHSHTHSHHNHSHNHSSNVAQPAHTQLESVLLTTLQARYGLHDKLTLHAQVPFWVAIASDKHAPTFGDVALLASYKVLQNEKYGIGATIGLELPTGSSYIVFESNYLITGSGSFDPLAGISLWFSYKKWLTRIQTQYRQGMKGFDGIRFGSTLNTQSLVAYSILQNEQKMLRLNLNTGLNQDWNEAHRVNNQSLDNTGGFILWYHVGAQVQYKKWLFPISFQIPIYTWLQGMQNEPYWRIRTGLTLFLK
ncbi:MAG: hypothetical protein NZ519_05250 [Bacteroidia bacterium]|nr:hypothetical protein [Bacteroidia bacterium]